jgi:hypothetical protein
MARAGKAFRVFGAFFLAFAIDVFVSAVSEEARTAPKPLHYVGVVAALITLTPIFLRHRHLSALSRLEPTQRRRVYILTGGSIALAFAIIATVASTNNAAYLHPGMVLLIAAIFGAYFVLEGAPSRDH